MNSKLIWITQWTWNEFQPDQSNVNIIIIDFSTCNDFVHLLSTHFNQSIESAQLQRVVQNKKNRVCSGSGCANVIDSLEWILIKIFIDFILLDIYGRAGIVVEQRLDWEWRLWRRILTIFFPHITIFLIWLSLMKLIIEIFDIHNFY